MTLNEMLKFYNEKAGQLNLPERKAAFRSKSQAISALAEVGITYTEDTAVAKEEAKAEAAEAEITKTEETKEPSKPKKKAAKKVKTKKAKGKERNANAFKGKREIIIQKLLAAKGKPIAFTVLAKAIDGSIGAVSLAVRAMELKIGEVMPGHKLIKEKKGKEWQIALQTGKRSTI